MLSCHCGFVGPSCVAACIVVDLDGLHVCVSFGQDFFDDMAIWDEVQAYDGNADDLKKRIHGHVMQKASVQQMMQACKDFVSHSLECGFII